MAGVKARGAGGRGCDWTMGVLLGTVETRPREEGWGISRTLEAGRRVEPTDSGLGSYGQVQSRAELCVGKRRLCAHSNGWRAQEGGGKKARWECQNNLRTRPDPGQAGR